MSIFVIDPLAYKKWYAMNIEIGKFYKTRDGRKVRIYALDGEGEFPIHGAVYLTLKGYDVLGWQSSDWTSDGISTFNEDEDIISEWFESRTKAFYTEAPGYYEFFENGSFAHYPPDGYKSLTTSNWIVIDEPGYIVVKEGKIDSFYKEKPQNVEHINNIPLVKNDKFLDATKEYKNFVINNTNKVTKRIGHQSPATKSIMDIENERLLEGKSVQVDNFQDHFGHTLSHQKYFADNTSSLTEEQKDRFVKHILEHTDYLIRQHLTSCSCGGPGITHKQSCPEYKTTHPLYHQEQGESIPIGVLRAAEKKALKCECGAESIGATTHSEWCVKA